MIAEAKSYFMPLVNHGLAFLLPPLCPSCRQPIGDAGGICVECWSELNFIEEPYCKVLGYPFEFEGEELSDDAKHNPPYFDLSRSVMMFNNKSRTLIHHYKYHDRLDLTPLFTTLMVRAGAELIEKCDIIIPVPMHWQRFFMRRYNQAAELARNIAKATDKPYEPRILLRHKKTKKQVGLSQFERNHNLEAAFSVPDNSLIEGKSVLLIDDVMTTGATLSECAKELKAHGAKNVYVLTLARVELGGVLAHS